MDGRVWLICLPGFLRNRMNYLPLQVVIILIQAFISIVIHNIENSSLKLQNVMEQNYQDYLALDD